MIDLLAVGEALAVGRVGASGLTRFLPLGVGGAELNVAVALRNAGRSVRFATRLGDDPFGALVSAALQQADVDAHVEIDEAAPTGFYLRAERVVGRHAYYYRVNSAGSRLPDVGLIERSIRNARVIHLTGITAALRPENTDRLATLMSFARSAGCRVSFDINFRPQLWSAAAAAAPLAELASQADLVFVGADEAEDLWGVADFTQLREILHGPELVYKDGDALQVTVERDEVAVVVELSSARVVDAVGAGDAFAAGYLHAAMAGESAPRDLVAMGHAFACAVMESTSDVLGRDAVNRALSNRVARNWTPKFGRHEEGDS